ncbi:MAG: putative bifunctional diguanylate cyclase/phosphodiesterase [Planctomycetota bacterium]|jgi:diguanylate cyclase (GGDEF)-like protein
MSRRQQVLFIDHSELIQVLVGARLMELDVELTTAENGRDGLRAARQLLPDLILLEVGLPDVNGFEVCELLRKDPRTHDIPVFFLAESDDPQDKVRGFELGAVDYVTKPFHEAELRARLRAALKTLALVDMLENQARTDALTGLANRALLTDRLNQAIRQAKENPDYKFAVLFLDFDRFKIINDSLGHEIGDQLLMGIANRLTTTLRAPDRIAHLADGHLPARLGGDEFVILLDGVGSIEDAVAVADRLQQELSTPHAIGDHQVTSTASIGIVASAAHYQRADDVLRDADTAMYHAKTTGKARHVVFDPGMHHEVVERLKLEEDLRRAVDQKDLKLDYQPIVSLTTGRLMGFEALLRWTHEGRGRVSPAEFVALAEEIGLIVPIGRWVLAEAARQLKCWHEQFPLNPPLTMNVNLSRRQLSQPDLVQVVQEILANTGIEPASLKLEITEGAIMASPEHVTPLLNRLQGLGVRLCMDDFGTGHSSLSCLHRFPIDALKIDRTFVLNTDENREYAAVIHAIITLAHTLNMHVVGEGVETAGQLAQLQALECDHAQGYYFAESLSAEAAEEFMRQPNRLARSA